MNVWKNGTKIKINVYYVPNIVLNVQDNYAMNVKMIILKLMDNARNVILHCLVVQNVKR